MPWNKKLSDSHTSKKVTRSPYWATQASPHRASQQFNIEVDIDQNSIYWVYWVQFWYRYRMDKIKQPMVHEMTNPWSYHMRFMCFSFSYKCSGGIIIMSDNLPNHRTIKHVYVHPVHPCVGQQAWLCIQDCIIHHKSEYSHSYKEGMYAQKRKLWDTVKKI